MHSKLNLGGKTFVYTISNRFIFILTLYHTKMNQLHLRHVLYYIYQKQGARKNASAASKEVCEVYGANSVSANWAIKLFDRFKAPDFDLSTGLEDQPRSGRPKELGMEELEGLLDDDASLSTRKLAEVLGVDHSTIVRRLHELGKKLVVGKWVPHQLTEMNKIVRLNTCIELLARHNRSPFLQFILTGDESWVYYENPTQKKFWLSPNTSVPNQAKRNLHAKKALLCVWWDQRGIVHYELLPEGQTVNADRYSAQLRRVNAAIQQKRARRDRIILLHDNAKPHVAKTTRRIIEEFGWEVLAHPPYSPDLAPSDYHLFLSLKDNLRDVTFKSLEDAEKWVKEFFESKQDSFYYRGIQKLPERWEKAIAAEGDYFD